MVTAIHTPVHIHIMVILHITLLVMGRTLARMHIAVRGLQRLRCNQYKKGQKYKFHNSIIHIFLLNGMAYPFLTASV